MVEEPYHASTGGVIGNTEVEIAVESPNEKVAELIFMDLKNRAEELNQIVELERHPDAVKPEARIDWEGWLHGEYDGSK